MCAVHFRKKRSSESLSLQPSNSPITFWQIVKCDNQNSGKIIFSRTASYIHLVAGWNDMTHSVRGANEMV